MSEETMELREETASEKTWNIYIKMWVANCRNAGPDEWTQIFVADMM